jgi:hypothetical protein
MTDPVRGRSASTGALRVVVLGPGGAGKSTFARELAAATGLPRVELDTVFWSADLTPTPLPEWRDRQVGLAAGDRWVLDGDLGPYDDPAPRLARATDVALLSLPLRTCARRAARRGRERSDFWRYLVTWHRRSRPRLLRAVATHAPTATLHEPRSPAAVATLLTDLTARMRA